MCANCDLSVCGRNGREFSVLQSETECRKFLGSFEQPTYCLRTFKTVQVDGWTKIVHVCCLQNIFLKINGLECVRKEIVNAWNLMC